MKSLSNINEIVAFLRELQANNNRPWFQQHRTEYDALRLPWEQDVERLIGMMSEWDPSMAGLTVKQSVYRIYRDVRFSKDKSPYKNYFSAVVAKDGRHCRTSGDYIHFQPDNCMIGGGIWWPDKPILDELRSLIDAEGEEFLQIVEAPEIASRYHWESETLKRMPKGWPENHPLARFIKMKEYLLIMRPDTSYFDCDDWVARVNEDLKPLKRVHDFLNYVFE